MDIWTVWHIPPDDEDVVKLFASTRPTMMFRMLTVPSLIGTMIPIAR